jgi:coproporphyrinogen III oxidase-like Fe-S oxidoreductase
MIARPPASPEPPGLDLHFPFCAVRCTYCDFPTVAGQDALVEDYRDAVVLELSTCQPDLPSAIDTVFVGAERRVLGSDRERRRYGFLIRSADRDDEERR